MAEFPSHIGIPCGETECNVLTEYCRHNAICRSCNEDVCKLQHADFPSQCTFYCQRESTSPGCTDHYIYLVIISILVLMFLITLAIALYQRNRIRKAKSSWKSNQTVTKDEETSLNEAEDTDSALSSSDSTDFDGPASLPNTTRDLKRTLTEIYTPQNDRGSRAKLVPAGMESHSITIEQE